MKYLPVALIVTAASLRTPAGPDPAFYRPVIDAITIGSDTVWFCSSASSDVAPVDFLWIRRTREWKRAAPGLAARCTPRSSRRSDDAADTGRIAPGLRLTRILGKRDSTQTQLEPDLLELIDDVNGRRTTLTRTIDTLRVATHLDGHGELLPDTISSLIGATTVSDTLVWIGLYGGFGEDGGTFGGVYRVDRRTGDHELFLHDGLDASQVTGIASIGGWLWVASQRPGEYGPYSGPGLLSREHRTGEWRAYTDSTSPLPDDLIRKMASDGKILALATAKGLAIVDVNGGPSGDAITRWDVRYFQIGRAHV